MNKKTVYPLILATALACTLGCRSPEEKAVDERIEAKKEIGEAQRDVQKTEVDSAKKILDADSAKEQAEKKIEATEDLADAQHKVDKEKMEASREIAEADRTAAADAMKR